MTTAKRHLSMLYRQLRFDLLVFWRNPAATFFTTVLPLIFLIIFTSIFGNEALDNGANASTSYVPGILCMSIVAAATINLANTMTVRRERGMLKRLRGTPVPPWIFICSQALSGFVVSVVMTVLIVTLGRIAYGVELNVQNLPALLITLVLGATAFSFLGLAMTALIPSEDAAPAVTNAIVLPLYFISDVFIPGDQIPDWVTSVAKVFPVVHLSQALQDSFNPFVTNATWPWTHWLVIAAWGVFGAVVSVKMFRWTPRR